MTAVYCKNSDCVHNVGYGMCDKEVILVGDGLEYGCRDYENYREIADYQNEYYIRVMAADDKVAKGVMRGKIIEYNGYTFFTSNHPSEKTYVTEKRTGIMWGSLEDLKEKPQRWLLAVERNKAFCDVEDLPLTEYNEKTRKWEYIEDENRGSEKEPQ